MTKRTNHAPDVGTVEHINPVQMVRSPAFTQAVAVSGPVKTLYIGLQNAIDASGSLVGKGDIAVQTEQVLRNIGYCLEAAGGGPEHLVSVSVYITQGQPIQPGFAVFQRWWGNRPNPPANTVLYIAGSLDPEILIGVEAIAVIPLGR